MFHTKVATFVFIVLGFMLVPPTVNWFNQEASSPLELTKESLYNIDFVVKPLQQWLFDSGIELNSKRVVIGKQKWLFLGDRFAQNVTRRINGVSAHDRTDIKKSIEQLQYWQAYFQESGVKDFRVLLGPDKATIYPEHLPDWARAAKPTKTDELGDQLRTKGLDSLVVDPRQKLTDAKTKYRQSLYMQTDTHWNGLGAWIAFEHFADQSMLHSARPTQWLTRDMVSFEQTDRSGGDLARMLRIDLADSTQSAVLTPPAETTTTKYLISSTHLEKMEESRRKNFSANAHQHLTENALNDRKVLLIGDSFSSALLPYFSRTFRDLVSVHHSYLSQEILTNIIDVFKPEAIYIVIVERDSIDQFLGLKEALK